MRLSEFTIKHLAKMITGDAPGWPYRSGWRLVEFFNHFGFHDEYHNGFPTRYIYAEEKLNALNGTEALRKVFRHLLDPRNWMSPEGRDVQSIGTCVHQLNELIKLDDIEIVPEGRHFFQAISINQALVEVETPLELNLSEASIDTHIQKCRDKIANGDYEGAITNARSLAEVLLITIEHELDPSPLPHDGDMVRLYNRVRGHLNLAPNRNDISDALKQVLSGLASVVHGLATMRNKMSDAHATSYKPSRHHAKLAVNSAKTFCDFLLETVAYQREKGLLRKPEVSSVNERK